jgi:hypothetical protein
MQISIIGMKFDSQKTVHALVHVHTEYAISYSPTTWVCLAFQEGGAGVAQSLMWRCYGSHDRGMAVRFSCPTTPPIPWAVGTLSPDLRRPNIKNALSCASTFPWHGIRRRDNFSLQHTRKALKVASPFATCLTQYKDSLLVRTQISHGNSCKSYASIWTCCHGVSEA